MQRLPQFLLILSTLLGSWLGMQAVHELGHILGARLTGGIVEQVVLHPLKLSRTDLSVNPHPLAVVWAGPMIGVIIPLLLWGIARLLRLSGAFVLRFFAGFCLIANGCYIGIGSFGRVGDCRVMLGHGSAAWQLWLFGLICIPLGLWLMNGLGKSFGLGPAGGSVSRPVMIITAIATAGLIALGLMMGG